MNAVGRIVQCCNSITVLLSTALHGLQTREALLASSAN